jgi:hypothetical protein
MPFGNLRKEFKQDFPDSNLETPRSSALAAMLFIETFTLESK